MVSRKTKILQFIVHQCSQKVYSNACDMFATNYDCIQRKTRNLTTLPNYQALTTLTIAMVTW